MSRFADPNSCPNCGGPAYGEQRCAGCGVLLLGPTPQLLLSVLADADRILDGLRAEADGWRRASSPAAAYAAGPPFPVPPREVTARRRSWSAGSILLALGAGCLVVAAFVFVSVSWGALGLLGRTGVLALLTLVLGGAAATVTARRLRASAEALWTVAIAMLAIDYVGARAYGLLGMDTWSGEVSLLALGGLVGAAGVAASRYARRVRGPVPIVGDAAAALGVTLAVVSAAGLSAVEPVWTALVLVVPVIAVAAGLYVIGMRYASAYVGCVAGLLQVTAAGRAGHDALAQSSLTGLVAEGGALSTIAASAMTIALGIVAERVVRRRDDTDLVRLVAAATTALAAAQLLVLGYAPVRDDIVEAQLVAAGSAVVLTVVGIAARTKWLRGIRVPALLSAVPVAHVAAIWCATALASVARSATPVWSADTWATVPAFDVGLGPAWLAGVSLGSLALSAIAVAHWSDVELVVRVRRGILATAAALGGVGVLATMTLLQTPVVLIAVAVVAIGALVAGLGTQPRRHAVGLAIVVAAAPVALVSQVASLGTWGLVALAAVAVALRTGRTTTRPIAVGVAVDFGALAAMCAVDLAGADDRTLHLTLVLTGAGVVVAGQFVRVADVRIAVEVVGGGFAAVAAIVGFALPLGWQSAMLTVLGAALVGISLLRPDRRGFRVPGATLLALAYLVRLVASDVGVVEAYTLPFGIALLTVGYARMRAVSTLRTRAALLPGLSLALLPSLPSVLLDPTTPRGLLLGLAAGAVLAVGVWRRWQTPFVIGAALVGLLTIRHLGPYADAVPRWTLLAAAGVTLLVVGVTWESRVREARAAVSYVGAMR